jgi:chorismate mutase
MHTDIAPDPRLPRPPVPVAHIPLAPQPTATHPPAGAAPLGPGDPGPPPDITSVAEGRAVIDGIDDQLRALLHRRAVASRQVQALRQADGGPRIQHRRENEIIAGYRASLGRPGVGIALAVLALCRGEPAPGTATSAAPTPGSAAG